MEKNPDKWERKDLVFQIQTLVSRCDALEIAIKDLELDCAQYRLALCGAQASLHQALTNNPFPWSPEEQKIWDDAKKNNKAQEVRQVTKPGRKLPPPDWHKDKSLPY